MKSITRVRLMRVAVLMALTGLVVTGVAYATPPSDQGPSPLATVPDCKAPVADTGGAHICKVRAVLGGNWQAGTGEWIVVRAGSGSDTQAACLADEATIVATITIDGKNLPVDTISCAFVAAFGGWFVDWRALSHPLPKGDHAIVETWYVGGVAVATFPATLTVSNPG